MRGPGVRGDSADVFTVTHSLTGGNNDNSAKAYSKVFRPGSKNQLYEPVPNH